MGDNLNNINNHNNNTAENNNGGHGEKEITTYPGLRPMPYVIGYQAFEKLATIGIILNLTLYLTSKFHLTMAKANQISFIFGGTCDLATVVGAFLSDAFLGRYICLAVGSVASLMGMVIWMLTSSAIPSLTGHLGFLYGAFGFLVIGAGGIRACNLAFGVDQFHPYARRRKSFFNWYFITTGTALLISLSVISYLQSINWTIGLAVPACSMLFSIFPFFLGTHLYVRVGPQGSPFTSFAQVIVAAFNKRRLALPRDPASLFHYVPSHSTTTRLSCTNQFRFLDKAAIVATQTEVNPDGSAVNPWRLCPIQQDEDVKCWLRIMPFWVSTINHNVAMNVQGQYTMFQALLLNRHLGRIQIPPKSYGLFTLLSGISLMLIYDRVVVPVIRKRTGWEGGTTLIQRMGAGVLFAALTMFASGVVENIRKHFALSGPAYSLNSPMSGFVLLPQLILAGFSEAFYSSAQMNFYYNQMPPNIKALSQAMIYASGAVSSYFTAFISSFFKTTWLVEDLDHGKLDFFYYLIGALEVVNLAYFLVCAGWFRQTRIDA